VQQEPIVREMPLTCGAGPAEVDAVALSDADAKRHKKPHEDRQLRDLVDGRSTITGEERVELLLHDEAGSCKHAHTAVGQLRLTPRQHLRGRL